ncbi:hypothetical protein AwWohl_04510 [Gammaproteobacteria bacterium]|nr:hypothetical protein AwWohl_04510 [Gammaproteobacteria bacterium]
MQQKIWQLSSHTQFKQLAEQFTWVQDMYGVVQDKVYHAEGDVATHTDLVLKALENLPEYQLLNLQDQNIIWAAALMHDIEKRSTTVEENGIITFKDHSKLAEKTVRRILFSEVLTPYWIREQICALVALHDLPLWFMEKQNIKHSILQAADRTPLKLLAMLAKANILGSSCQDSIEMLERIELFEQEAANLGCLEHIY